MKRNFIYFTALIVLLLGLWILFVTSGQYAPMFEPFDLPPLAPKDLQLRLQEGEGLFVQTGCLNCHSFQNHQKAMTSSLNHLKKSTQPGFGKAWLENPQKMKPGVKMPRPKISPSELLSLLYYLYSLPDTK
jgi:cytochrome c2